MYASKLLILVLVFIVHLGTCQDCGTWQSFKGKCYYISQSSVELETTWYDAREFCFHEGADIVSISDVEEEDFINNMILSSGLSHDIWIGLNRNQELSTFEWSDGSEHVFKMWGPSQPDADGVGNCVMTKVENHTFAHHDNYNVVKGLMEHPEDEDRPRTYYFGHFFSEDRQLCEDHCFHTPGCQAYSYFHTSYPDMNWNHRCVGRGDGDTLVAEPYADSGVRDVAGQGQWFNQNCGLKKAFICKKDPQSNPIVPTPTTLVPGYCPAGYTAVGNKCFRLHLYEADRKNWSMALHQCRTQPGYFPTLASITSFEENAWFTAQLVKQEHSLWIGIYAFGLSRDWLWTDNSQVDYTNWGEKQPEQWNCGAFMYSPTTGLWETTHCDRPLGYICQTIKDPMNIISTPPTTTRHYCASQFISYNSACYYFEPVPKIWEGLQFECRFVDAFLTSIHSDAENSAALLMANGTTPFWLGLRKNPQTNVFEWNDGWITSYTNWGEGQPSGEGDCAVMNSNGLWETANCSENSLPGLCKNTHVSAPTTPSHMDGVCPSDDWIKWGSHCYLIVNTEDRDPDKSPVDWHTANERCQEYSGRSFKTYLASIHGQQENNFIKNITLSKFNFADKMWIGLSKDALGAPYSWSDSSPANYFPWAPGEPNDFDGTHNCVEMYLDWSRGTWNDDDCDRPISYVACKTNQGRAHTQPPTPPTMPGDCPTEEWEEFGSSCYLFKTEEETTFHDAEFLCRRSGGPESYLASIHDVAEDWYIWDRLKSHSTNQETHWPAWIGLYKDTIHPFRWADGSCFTYQNWAYNEPSEPREQLDACVEMYVSTGEWNDADCDRLNGYVCKHDKVSSTASTTSTTTHTTPTTTHTTTESTISTTDGTPVPPTQGQPPGSNMSSGAIVGLSFLMLALGAAIGVVIIKGIAYMRRSSDPERIALDVSNPM